MSESVIPGARHPYAYCVDTEDFDDLPILCVLPDSCWSGACALADVPDLDAIASTLSITSDDSLLTSIREGYSADSWCKDLPSMSSSLPLVHRDPTSKLWFLGDRLIIPRVGSIREELFRLAHDNLGHFGFDKSYATL